MTTRSSGSVRDVSGDLERVGSFLGHLAAQQEQILERIDRLVALNERIWDHHLAFCGRLIESVTQTEVQLLEAQSELERQLAALRSGPSRPTAD
jgi:hypothetical protein